MLDDFRLRVFETLCSTLSFTQTAKLLGVSQPAISQNISELERDLGVSLFDRNGGKVPLTKTERSSGDTVTRFCIGTGPPRQLSLPKMKVSRWKWSSTAERWCRYGLAGRIYI